MQEVESKRGLVGPADFVRLVVELAIALFGAAGAAAFFDGPPESDPLLSKLVCVAVILLAWAAAFTVVLFLRRFVGRIAWVVQALVLLGLACAAAIWSYSYYSSLADRYICQVDTTRVVVGEASERTDLGKKLFEQPDMTNERAIAQCGSPDLVWSTQAIIAHREDLRWRFYACVFFVMVGLMFAVELLAAVRSPNQAAAAPAKAGGDSDAGS